MEFTPLKIISMIVKTHIALIKPTNPQGQEFLRLLLSPLYHRGLDVFVLPFVVQIGRDQLKCDGTRAEN
jgi:hypothetical protein